jgi:hypothetical protein
MDRKVAHHIVLSAFRSADELETLLGFLKEHCEVDEYKKFALGVAGAIDAVNTGLIDKVLAQFPEIAREIEADIAKYGKVL